MTGLMCIFAFLCITEIQDRFLRDNLLKEEEQAEQNRRSRSRRYDEYEEEVDCDLKPCFYELCMCGIVRNCLLRDEMPGEHEATRKRSKCGTITFTILTFVFGCLMTLSNTQLFSNVSASF